MTAGNPLKLIITFSIPLLLSNIFQQIYSISDIVLVGRLIGVQALAAVGAAAPLFFILVVVSIGFTNGLTVITAQSFGAQNFERMKKSVATATMLSCGFTVLFGCIIYFCLDSLLRLMNVPEEIFAETRKFLVVICSGVLFIVGFNFLSGLMRALGDSKTPLYFLIFTTIINIALNIVFIYFCKMGVSGSALGTVAAMFISVICCLLFMRKKFSILKPSVGDWRFDAKFCGEHLVIAIPMAIQFSIIALSLAITQTICNKFGFATIAAMTAALRVEQLATQPMLSVGIAMATYVAQNYGAQKIGRIRRGVFDASMVVLAMSAILAAFVFVFGADIIKIFVSQKDTPSELFAEVLQMAKTYMHISISFYFFLGQIFIFRNSCQGMGNSLIPMISSFVELCMRCFAAIYLTSIIGFAGLCYASPIAWIGGVSVVCLGYYGSIYKISKKLKNKTA